MANKKIAIVAFLTILVLLLGALIGHDLFWPQAVGDAEIVLVHKADIRAIRGKLLEDRVFSQTGTTNIDLSMYSDLIFRLFVPCRKTDITQKSVYPICAITIDRYGGDPLTLTVFRYGKGSIVFAYTDAYLLRRKGAACPLGDPRFEKYMDEGDALAGFIAAIHDKDDNKRDGYFEDLWQSMGGRATPRPD